MEGAGRDYSKNEIFIGDLREKAVRGRGKGPG